MITETISASDFKAKCLDLLDRVGQREIGPLHITKRGKVVAVLSALPADSIDVGQLHGLLRGCVMVPDVIDLTAPVLDGPFDADEGVLHG